MRPSLLLISASLCVAGCDRFADDDPDPTRSQTTLTVTVEPRDGAVVGDTLRLRATPADGAPGDYAYRWTAGDAPGRALPVEGTLRGPRLDYLTAPLDEAESYSLAFTVFADDGRGEAPPASAFLSVTVRRSGR